MIRIVTRDNPTRHGVEKMESTIEETNGRKLDDLENYFHSYRDLPREIILKHDLLRVGHWSWHPRLW